MEVAQGDEALQELTREVFELFHAAPWPQALVDVCYGDEYLLSPPAGEPFMDWQGDELDVNEVFQLLPLLSMEPGWVLDYEYIPEDLAGYTNVFSRQEDDPPHVATGIGPLEHLLVDDSAEGYVQLVLLVESLPMLYSCWHSYELRAVVVDPAFLLDMLEDEHMCIPDEDLKGFEPFLVGYSFRPHIERDDTTVQLSFATYRHWHGIIGQQVTIQRGEPASFERTGDYDPIYTFNPQCAH